MKPRERVCKISAYGHFHSEACDVALRSGSTYIHPVMNLYHDGYDFLWLWDNLQIIHMGRV